MFLTLLVVAHLHYTQPNGIKLHTAKPTVVAQLHLQAQGVQLKPAHLTIVKTWTY
jgi:hypothetical protein